jgi:hypothetical protein
MQYRKQHTRHERPNKNKNLLIIIINPYPTNSMMSFHYLLDDNNDDNNDDVFTLENDQSLPSAPDSLLSSALPQSLSSSSTTMLISDSHIPSRPRTLWDVQDNFLQHIPKHYPPLNPNCTIFISNTAPSVVAIRIAECLRQRSIAVEYDEESSTATAMTVDRCHFQIQLWKGKITPKVDFSDGVVVECIRRSGDTMSFHHACRAVLLAANGEGTGQDTRKPHQTNGMDFHKLLRRPLPLSRSPSNSRVDATQAAPALEQVRELLQKDRLECQQLGMERLIHLTTPSTCGDECALMVSKTVLQESWLYPHILIKEEETKEVTTTISLLRPSMIQRSDSTSPTNKDNLCWNENKHASIIRAYALRVLCNALSNLASSSEENTLSTMLESSTGSLLIHPKLLDTLATDLQGANRPPSVVESGCSLASIHEAALAVRCLRILGEHSSKVKQFLQSDTVLDRLEAARSSGRATHVVLQEEAEQIVSKLTEDIRSC